MPCLDDITSCSNDSFLPVHRGAALVIAKPRTGRTHQVRLHSTHTTVTCPTLQLYLHSMFQALAGGVNDRNSMSACENCAACFGSCCLVPVSEMIALRERDITML